MIVYKFGGALARSRRGLETLVRLTTEAHRKESVRARRSTRHATTHGLVLVVSAIGHTTRHIARAAELAEQGDLRQAEQVLDRSITQHQVLAEQLGLADATEDAFERIATDIRSLLEGIAIVRELTPRTRDAAIASGEDLAATLITALLESHDLPVRFIDARELIITNERHGNAEPISDEVEQHVRHRILPRLARSEIVLTQGFIGSTLEGATTTMGSESSDLSATLLAGALGASEVIIWKTLPGLFTADPELVPNAKLIRSLTFDEAEEMGRRGARILFPSFAHPLMEEGSKTVLRIATPFSASPRHTLLQRELVSSSARSRLQKALAVAVRQKLVLLRIAPGDADASASPQHLTSSTTQDCRTSERMNALVNTALAAWHTPNEQTVLIPKEDRAQWLRELERVAYVVRSEQSVAGISLIIRKPRDRAADPRFAAQLARSLRAFQLHATLPIEGSIFAVIDEAESLAAVRKVHRDLFEG